MQILHRLLLVAVHFNWVSLLRCAESALPAMKQCLSMDRSVVILHHVNDKMQAKLGENIVFLVFLQKCVPIINIISASSPQV